MKEINNYWERKSVKDAPEIRKLGIKGNFGESTPFIWHGKLKWLHTVSKPGMRCFEPNAQQFVIRDDETNEVSGPFCTGYHFYSCYEENGTLYVFATDETNNMWGGESVVMMWSSDLEHWEEKVIINRPGWLYYNTSVCKGRNGKYVIAIEAGKPQDKVGVPFTIFFAESDDLMDWSPMDDDIHYNDKRYTACPSIRYIKEDDFYYMVCLEALPMERYAPYIYRTRDFTEWEIGVHNPVLWISKEDKQLAPGAEKYIKEENMERYDNYVNINNCDLDFCEFDGKTKICYLTGNQHNISFYCEAEFDGTLKEFLQSFFE